MRLSHFTFTFYFQALEKEMATHSSVLAWRILGMGEPSGLLSMGSHRVGHDWRDLAAAARTIDNTLSCFADTETYTGREKLTVSCPEAQRSQTSWSQKVDDADFRWPPHQPIRRISRSWSHPSPQTLKDSSWSSPSPGQDTQALAHCGTLCLAKQ